MQDVLFTPWLRYSGQLYPLVAVSSLRGSSDQVRAITILSYRNQALCYSRTVAYFSGPAMLFSSGDSPQSASSNLSGEGFDEVQPGESPFVVSAAKSLGNSLSSPAQRGLNSNDLCATDARSS
jgi:hypothetical protein